MAYSFDHAKTRDIFPKGDPGRCFYVIVRGEVEIFVPQEDGSELRVVILKNGAAFGELALITEASRAASIRCLIASDMAILKRDHFKKILASKQKEALKNMVRFLEKIPLFASLTPRTIQLAFLAMEQLAFTWGDLVAKEDETIEHIFIIKKGELKLTKVLTKLEQLPFDIMAEEHAQGMAKEKQMDICVLKEGDFFGDIEVLLQKKTMFNYVCISAQCEIMKFHKEDFFLRCYNPNNPKTVETVDATLQKRSELFEKLLQKQVEFFEKKTHQVAPSRFAFARLKTNQKSMIHRPKSADTFLENEFRNQNEKVLKKFGHDASEERKLVDLVQIQGAKLKKNMKSTTIELDLGKAFKQKETVQSKNCFSFQKIEPKLNKNKNTLTTFFGGRLNGRDRSLFNSTFKRMKREAVPSGFSNSQKSQKEELLPFLTCFPDRFSKTSKASAVKSIQKKEIKRSKERSKTPSQPLAKHLFSFHF